MFCYIFTYFREAILSALKYISRIWQIFDKYTYDLHYISVTFWFIAVFAKFLLDFCHFYGFSHILTDFKDLCHIVEIVGPTGCPTVSDLNRYTWLPTAEVM